MKEKVEAPKNTIELIDLLSQTITDLLNNKITDAQAGGVVLLTNEISKNLKLQVLNKKEAEDKNISIPFLEC